MSFPWFRVYSEIRNDAKIRSLAFEDRWHFIALLTLKSDGVIDAIGDPAIRDRRIGLELGLDAKHAAEAKRRLIEAFLIDDAWQPFNWSKRQFNSDRDPTNAERQRRFKEKQSLTKYKPVSNALPALPVTKITLTDTDTDTDTDTEKRKTQDSSERSAIAAEPAVISIPLVSGADYGITGTQLREYQAAYPGIDALAELKALRAWNLSNPKNRKTKSGVLRHVNAWLARAQNSARRDFGGTRNESAHRRFGEGAL